MVRPKTIDTACSIYCVQFHVENACFQLSLKRDTRSFINLKIERFETIAFKIPLQTGKNLLGSQRVKIMLIQMINKMIILELKKAFNILYKGNTTTIKAGYTSKKNLLGSQRGKIMLIR